PGRRKAEHRPWGLARVRPRWAQCEVALAETAVAVNTDVLGVTDFSGLVESVYKGPLESPPWKTFLESMKALLSASFTVIILRPAAPERPPVLVVAGPVSVEATEAYNTRFFEMD